MKTYTLNELRSMKLSGITCVKGPEYNTIFYRNTRGSITKIVGLPDTANWGVYSGKLSMIPPDAKWLVYTMPSGGWAEVVGDMAAELDTNGLY